MSEPTIFFDRTFGRRFPEILKSARPPFVIKTHFDERFKDNMPDDEWLSVIGGKGWFVLSEDSRFHRDSAALLAIEQFRIGCFYVWSGQLPIWNKVIIFTAAFSKMRDKMNSVRKPFIFQVAKTGRLRTIRSWDDRQVKKAVRPKSAIEAVHPDSQRARG